MICFNVLRPLISEDCYYIFTHNDKIFYEGFKLPKKLDDCIIIEIGGGKDVQGEQLYFTCYNKVVI